MRFLFTSAQLAGHLDWGGYLRTAAVLAARGHDVLWVSGHAVEASVRAAGVPFRAVSETGWRWPPAPPLPRGAMSAEAWAAARAQRALDQWLEPERVALAAAALEPIAAAFAPQLIVTENFVAAAALVAERRDLRLVVAGWPAFAPRPAQNAAHAAFEADLRARLAQWQSSGRYFTPSGPPGLLSPWLHLTYWSPSWYAAPLAPQTRHVGGRAPAAASHTAGHPIQPARPLILITLGTAFNRDPAFFAAAAAAAVAVGGRPVIAAGPLAPDEMQALAQRLPAAALLHTTVDFAALLPQIAAAVHHGGAGTSHALIIHAVPQIVVPHAGDQMQQAQGIVHTGVGVHIPPADVTPGRIEHALRALLAEDAVARSRAIRLRDEFAALGGPDAAADLLEAQAAQHNA